MKAAFIEAVDQLFGEGKFILASLDVYKYSGAASRLFQCAQSKDERGFAHAARGSQQDVCAIGEFTLEPGEIARAVKEIVVFDGGSSDISHLGNANRL
jgi:hypothetical protein